MGNEPEEKGLQAELQAILPLPGDPFRKEGAQFHPLFELTLPKNTGWTRARRMKSDRKRIEGWLLGVNTTLSRANMS
jgi:hypothetical protein